MKPENSQRGASGVERRFPAGQANARVVPGEILILGRGGGTRPACRLCPVGTGYAQAFPKPVGFRGLKERLTYPNTPPIPPVDFSFQRSIISAFCFPDFSFSVSPPRRLGHGLPCDCALLFERPAASRPNVSSCSWSTEFVHRILLNHANGDKPAPNRQQEPIRVHLWFSSAWVRLSST